MPVWKMSASDYNKIKNTERFHFIHLNATSHAEDKSCFHMTFSTNVALMLRRDLGLTLEQIVVKDENGDPRPHDHPADAKVVPHDKLLATALNAPGFNKI
jgi:hypothetical protein